VVARRADIRRRQPITEAVRQQVPEAAMMAGARGDGGGECPYLCECVCGRGAGAQARG
jgi:hypothetical protein